MESRSFINSTWNVIFIGLESLSIQNIDRTFQTSNLTWNTDILPQRNSKDSLLRNQKPVFYSQDPPYGPFWYGPFWQDGQLTQYILTESFIQSHRGSYCHVCVTLRQLKNRSEIEFEAEIVGILDISKFSSLTNEPTF